MFAIVIGCEKQNEKTSEIPDIPEGVGILPVYESDMPEKVADFFGKHLPEVSGYLSECFFVEDKENRCLMVNSVDELKAIMSSSVELPAINFDDYTLVIGQYFVPGTGYRVLKHNIVIAEDGIDLNLSMEKPDGSYAVICPAYYYGLYPKLPKKPIAINIYKKTADPEQKGEDVPFTVYSFGEGSSACRVNFGNNDENNDNLNREGKILVINSDEELQKYVEGDYPPVDFSQNTLLLATGIAPNNLSNTIVQNLKQLSTVKYKWSVEIQLGIADIIQYWMLAILIDKLSADSTVELDVTFNYD